MKMHENKFVSFVRNGALAFILLVTATAGVAKAGQPLFDKGSELNTEKPYDNAQVLSDIYQSSEIYGKLEGATPIDIYSFSPNKDGKQNISLLVPKNGQSSAQSQPILILVDPTKATEADQLNLPAPDDTYHFALIKNAASGAIFNEPFLFQQYSLVADQKLDLQKGKKYYLIVLDPYRMTNNYAIKIGNSSVWGFADIFKHFSSWFKVKTNNYSGTSPFNFSVNTLGFILFLLGLMLLFGITAVQETFSFLANKSKAAGYVLVKLQPYSKVMIWISVWFTAMGGYIFFDRLGWNGIPFVLGLIFVINIINNLFITFKLSPKLAELEITKKEAAIPLEMRKKWFFSSMVNLITLLGFLVYLALYLNK